MSKWFAKFRSGDFNVKDARRAGRPVEIDNDEIKIKTLQVDASRHYTIRDVTEILNVSERKRGKSFKGTLIRE